MCYCLTGAGNAGFGITVKGGLHATLTRSDNLVESCHVHHNNRVFRTGQPALHWAGVGNTFRNNHVHDCPHYAIHGGANQATCTADAQLSGPTGVLRPGWFRNAWVPDDLGICGSSQNRFEGNVVEHAVYECDDSGAFNTCGQEGTAYINRDNVIIGNTFRDVRMRPTNDDGSGVLVGGNPIVAAIYFDAAESGWTVENNTFDGKPPFLLLAVLRHVHSAALSD